MPEMTERMSKKSMIFAVLTQLKLRKCIDFFQLIHLIYFQLWELTLFFYDKESVCHKSHTLSNISMTKWMCMIKFEIFDVNGLRKTLQVMLREKNNLYLFQQNYNTRADE